MQSDYAVGLPSLCLDRRITTIRQRIAIVIVVLATGFAPVVWAADDYLSELEAEADSSVVPPVVPAASGAGKPDQAARLAFERSLKATAPHVFTFYGRLTDADKAQIVEAYLKDPEKMPKVNKLIFDLYFKQDGK